VATEAELLLGRIERLKATAAEHQAKQEKARVQEAKARGDLDDLTDKLEQIFGTRDWTQAELLLPGLQEQAAAAVAKVEAQLAEAGLL
jgi:hypothetical protein